MEMGRPLQRLFSTFPDGWPGSGLLLLRVGAAIPLIYFGIAGTAESAEESVSVALRIVAAGGGLLLLLGLWTPVAGIAVAIDELWMRFPATLHATVRPMAAYHAGDVGRGRSDARPGRLVG